MAKILVIDDSPTVSALLTAILTPEGHEVCTLNSFVDLPIYLRRSPPDLVVLDLHMPTMDGLSFGRFIRQQQQRRIPIVVYSAAPASEVHETARALGAHGIAKNAPPSAIKRLVNQLIAHDRAHA
jgi:twitching motility two-component system response regulator PilH